MSAVDPGSTPRQTAAHAKAISASAHTPKSSTTARYAAE
jgi:hypothetical protein